MLAARHGRGRQPSASRIGWEWPYLGAGMSAPSDHVRSAFPLVALIVEGEPPMYRIETVVLVSLYALLAPLIITLALR